MRPSLWILITSYNRLPEIKKPKGFETLGLLKRV